jgi:hypothetical protein
MPHRRVELAGDAIVRRVISDLKRTTDMSQKFLPNEIAEELIEAMHGWQELVGSAVRGGCQKNCLDDVDFA